MPLENYDMPQKPTFNDLHTGFVESWIASHWEARDKHEWWKTITEDEIITTEPIDRTTMMVTVKHREKDDLVYVFIFGFRRDCNDFWVDDYYKISKETIEKLYQSLTRTN